MTRKNVNVYRLITSCLILLFLSACEANARNDAASDTTEKVVADKTEDEDEETNDNGTDDVTNGKPNETPARDYIGFSGDVFGAHFEIVGAQHFTGWKDKEVIMLFIDYTNNSKETKTANQAFRIEMYQDGERLEYGAASTNSEYEPIEVRWEVLDVRPGITLRVVNGHAYDPDGGMIDVTVSGKSGDQTEEVTFSIDPSNLSEERPDLFVIQPVSDPLWTRHLPKTESLSTVDGSSAFNATILNAEFLRDYGGNRLIRVYYEVENTGRETLRVEYDLKFEAVAFQDGVELWKRTPSFAHVEEELTSGKVIEPGQTLTLAQSFALHEESESPIEIELKLIGGEAFAGIVVELEE